jgi:hypothetical protein
MGLITVYHLSNVKNRESILKNGIIPKSHSGNYINYSLRIFVTKVLDSAVFDYVGYDCVDLWKFDLDENLLITDSFSSSDNHFFINEIVYPDKLELYKSY